MNWFERHLNWAYIIWQFVSGGMCFGGFAVMETVGWLGFSLYGIGVLISWGSLFWVLEQKKRSLWWIFLAGCGSPLWLSNRRQDNKVNTGQNNDEITGKKTPAKVQRNIYYDIDKLIAKIRGK